MRTLSTNAAHADRHDLGTPGPVTGSAGPTDVDVVGIGFGPSNLSLAIAIEEANRRRPEHRQLTARFIEAKPHFTWHNGMLLPETTMQISFLKDLVSLRNPTSPYTFVNYLHEHNRLSDFINLKTFFPSRQEFHDYLLWAAKRISLPVSYGMRATSVDWANGRFTVASERSAQTPHAVEEPTTQTFTARNVVMGGGLQPVLPQGITEGPRVFHNLNLLSHLANMPSRPHRRFLVIGSGQSAAEVAAYLHETYEDAEIHASFRRFGYTPSDDTPFANRIFDPDAVDEFYTAPQSVKDRLLNYHWLTNYSAVDADLINELYRRQYAETVAGTPRLFVHRTTQMSAIEETADGVTVTIRDLGDRHSTDLTVDAVVFATGFVPFDIRQVFGPSIDATSAFVDDLPQVKRNYALDLPSISGSIFLNGGVEHTHGLSSALLSNVPVRAADILAAVEEQDELMAAHA